MNHQSTWAVIGNFSFKPSPEGYGLTVCRYEEDGNLIPVGTYLKQIACGKVIADGTEPVLYCVDEKGKQPEFNNVTGGGKVYAVRLDPETGALDEINHQYTYAPQASYVCHDKKHQRILVSNHSGGDPVINAERCTDGSFVMRFVYNDVSLVLYPTGEDGAIGSAADINKVSGTDHISGDGMAHLHCVVQSPLYDELYFVCDKGRDQVYVYTVSDRQLKLLSKIGHTKGSMPRYGCCLKDHPVFVCNYEAASELSAFRYTPEGQIREVCTIRILPDEYASSLKAESSDLLLSSDNRHLYNITRGINEISVVKIDPENEKMQLVQTLHFEATAFCPLGARGGAISPDGKYLYVCVSDDGDIHRFRILPDGTLDPEDTIMHIGHPGCMHPGCMTFL